MMPITHRFTKIVGRLGVSRRLIPLLLLLALSEIASGVWAQEYATMPIDPNARANRSVAQLCAKDAATYAANKDGKFKDYFVGYHFPMMTRTEPDKIAEIGKLREELFKLFLKTSNTDLQQYLSELAYSTMGSIISAQNPPYHPAVRYNAILIIGALDDQYSPDGRQPPKPFAKATKALTGVVNTATTGNQFPPPVILGAIIGLERHAQFHQSLTPEAKTAMTAALLKLVNNDKPIQEMDRDAYSWMRLRAASALARLGSVGEKNAVHNAIVQLATTARSLDDRCAAAALLEKLNYKDVKLDDAGTAEPLFALARDVAVAEDKRAVDFQERGDTGAVPRFQIQEFTPGGTTGPPETFPRRHVLSRLMDLRSGIKAVKASLPAETQKKADPVLAALDTAIAAAASKDTVELNLTVAIRNMAESITQAIPTAVKPAEDKAKENAVF
jgi:hypothetical protein